MGLGGRSSLLAVCAVMAITTAGCGSGVLGSGATNGSRLAGELRAGAVARAAPGVHSTFPYGPFAGYLWLGPVYAVRADWNVPRILPGSTISRAATWIGAQGDGLPGPFIQVGVTEERSLLGDRYYAFWSDVRHDFRPQELFPVKPGDIVRATLTHARARWRVAIVDSSSGRRARFATTQEGHAAFDTAQWYQEDVTNSLLNRPFAYPRLSPVHFTGVAVDDFAPALDGLDFHWLRAPDGAVVAPGPLRQRGFAVAPLMRPPSAAGLRFLEIAHAEDAPALSFDAKLSHWSARTPGSVIATVGAVFLGALQSNLAAFRGYRWPRQVRAQVTHLIGAVEHLTRLIRRAPTLSASQRGGWLADVSDASTTVNDDAYNLRAALKMPAIGAAYTGPA